MKFYSTNNRSKFTDLRTAVLQGLPEDNGLYMPASIPILSETFIRDLANRSFVEIASEVAGLFLEEDFSEDIINDIATKAINFQAPLVRIAENLHTLELWHGPTLAFKDFGARFMAQVMSQLLIGEQRKLTILVATSGDTGGAVGAGFLGIDNVEVIILFPSGKVSTLQEKQLTSLGQNISALEVDGSFDDCQSLVKSAFLDSDIKKQYFMSSANSINIARLIPQSFYYFEGYKQLDTHDKAVSFSVPSGNFGNLTAGLLAKRMGLPIAHLIAATNINDIVPQYLSTREYIPKPSRRTISNAMDVGDPSNFVRLQNLFGKSWDHFNKDLIGFRYTDEETLEAIQWVNDNNNYVLDPHGAIGYLAGRDYMTRFPENQVIFLETAHPSKFLDAIEHIVGDISIPERLSLLAERESKALKMDNSFHTFKDWLISRNQ